MTVFPWDERYMWPPIHEWLKFMVFHSRVSIPFVPWIRHGIGNAKTFGFCWREFPVVFCFLTWAKCVCVCVLCVCLCVLLV